MGSWMVSITSCSWLLCSCLAKLIYFQPVKQSQSNLELAMKTSHFVDCWCGCLLWLRCAVCGKRMRHACEWCNKTFYDRIFFNLNTPAYLSHEWNFRYSLNILYMDSQCLINSRLPFSLSANKQQRAAQATSKISRTTTWVHHHRSSFLSLPIALACVTIVKEANQGEFAPSASFGLVELIWIGGHRCVAVCIVGRTRK